MLDDLIHSSFCQDPVVFLDDLCGSVKILLDLLLVWNFDQRDNGSSAVCFGMGLTNVVWMIRDSVQILICSL